MYFDVLDRTRAKGLTELDGASGAAGASLMRGGTVTRGMGALARDSVLSMAALMVLGGTRVVYGSMVSRVTDRETYGIVGVLIAVTMIASFVLPAGVAAATSRFVPYNRGRGDLATARGLYRVLARIGIGAAGLLSILATVAASVALHRPLNQSVEVGLLTFAYSLYITDKAALYGFNRVGRYLRLEVVASGVTLAATVAVIATGSTWYLLPFVIGYGVFIAGARVSVRADLRGEVGRPSRSDLLEIVGYAALACVGTLSSAGFLQGTQLLAAKFAAPVELAYFAAAVTLIAPMYFLPRALALALFPFMSEAHGAGELAVVRWHADLGTRALLVLLAPVFVVAELLSAEILALFGGAKYVDGAPVLQIILAGVYLTVIQVAAVNALSSGSGWQLRTPVAWAAAGFTVGLVTVAAVGGPLGAAGVGLAYLIGTMVTATGPITVVWRRYRMPWARPVARALLTVGTALAAARLLDSADIDGAARWAADIGAAVLAVSIALAVLRRDIASVLQSGRVRSGIESATDLGEAVAAASVETPPVLLHQRRRDGGART